MQEARNYNCGCNTVVAHILEAIFRQAFKLVTLRWSAMVAFQIAVVAISIATVAI